MIDDYMHYYHRDHLGNTCAVWNATADSVVQRTLYYASGMPMAGSTGQPYQPYKYNGKEFVNAYGYDEYDSQARWYYPAVMRTATIDPLSETYYATSPYVWCANNPVNMIDSDGNFPIPIHKEMVGTALSKTIITPSAIFQISHAASVHADLFASGNLHLDNMKSYYSLASAYSSAKNDFYNGIKNQDFTLAGEALHTIADFYSHSNYIPLYQEYAKAKGLSMDIKDIPTFSEAMNDQSLSKYLHDKGLKTGTFGAGCVPIEYVKDKFSTDKNSHGQMNLDSKSSPTGRMPYNNKNTMYEAAKTTAQKDLNRIVNNGQDY